MDTSIRIHRLTAEETRTAAPELGAVLKDCVDGGASVSFMADLTLERAADFWRDVASGMEADGRAVLVARDSVGVVGVVQVIPAWADNQPHRADVAKMLVFRRGRRRGLGEGLMRAAEQTARDLGKTVLVLDTVTGGDAERLYARLGWTQVGSIPDFALMPDGDLCATTVFYKQL